MSSYIHSTVRMGKKVKIGYNVIIKGKVVFGNNITIGDNVIIHGGTQFGNNIFIMDNCVIGKQPTAPFREHKTFKISKMPPTKFSSNIIIGTGSIIYAGSCVSDYLYTADSIIIREGCKIAKRVSIGKKVVVEHHVQLGEGTKLQSFSLIGEGMKVGKHVFIGPFFNGTCDKFMDRLEEFVFQPPRIKDYARIGAHVVMVAGTTLGKDTVVGAGAVVTKDIPDYSVAVGVPAKVIKRVPAKQRAKSK